MFGNRVVTPWSQAIVLILLAGSVIAGPDTATPPRAVPAGDDQNFLVGGMSGSASRDTVLLLGPWGSGAPFNGQFQTPDGAPAWNGWTTVDLTQSTESAWHVDSYNSEGLNGHGAENLAAWCGSLAYPSCDPADADGGYGNDYDERLEWVGVVADKTVACQVTVDAWLNYNLEPGFDFLYLELVPEVDPAFWFWSTDGVGLNHNLTEVFTCTPQQYSGEAADEVRLRFRVRSDGGWSDADCSFWSDGACQIDDLTVTLDNGGFSTFDDFQDGTLGSWELGYKQGAGDFAHLWTGLPDLDPCATNLSPQVAFIDDGEVVPGTGGSQCVNWCYGPGGYIVSPTGGLGDMWSTPIHNPVISPVLPVPADKEGCLFSFDVYVHEDLTADSPGIFYTWNVRSTTSSEPGALDDVAWFNRDFVYYGGPEYRRVVNEVSDLVVPGARQMQVRMEVFHLVYVWAWCPCVDGYPAPYFDNAQVQVFDFEGPSLTAYGRDLGQDSYPASGRLDPVDLSANSVRFDAAHEKGDSLVVSSAPQRSGASLTGPPVMHYRLQANPVFDSYRTAGLPLEGEIVGVQDLDDPNDYTFDPPDSGFLFPGDELRYFFRSSSDLSGAVGTTFLPADTTGFSDFADPLGYPPAFVVRGLPSVSQEADSLVHPDILLWDNAGDTSFRNEWKFACDELGLEQGRDYEVFRSNAPGSAEGNGLGSLATIELLSSYRVLLYSGGELEVGMGWATHRQEPSDDVGLLDQWLAQGGRGLLLSGDRLAQNLSSAPGDFLAAWAGVAEEYRNLRPLIDGQYSPGVAALPINPVFADGRVWRVNAMCPSPVTLNAITPTGSGVSLAVFTDPDGSPLAYPYSAAVWNDSTAIDTQVIFFPYDFSRLGTLPDGEAKSAAGPATRSIVLGEILDAFGHAGGGQPVPVPDGPLALAAASFPNPFNPRTRIEFTLPQRTHVSLKIYDLRGRLVATLADEIRNAGSDFADWQGLDDSGRETPSGTYFYRLSTADRSVTGKICLIR